jgi:hypothetical protein
MIILFSLLEQKTLIFMVTNNNFTMTLDDIIDDKQLIEELDYSTMSTLHSCRDWINHILSVLSQYKK